MYQGMAASYVNVNTLSVFDSTSWSSRATQIAPATALRGSISTDIWVVEIHLASASHGEPAPPPVITRDWLKKLVPVMVTTIGCEPAAAVLGLTLVTVGADGVPPK